MIHFSKWTFQTQSSSLSRNFYFNHFIPFIRWSICPFLYAESMLKILNPISTICWSIFLYIDSVPICLIIFPLSFINITIWVNYSSSSICLIINPIAFIKWEIFPNLFTTTIFQSSLKLPNIKSIIFHFDGTDQKALRWFFIRILERA